MKPLNEELKEIRVGKGISFEEIYDATKIRVSILKRIENGEFDFVPKPYMRAFLKEYAAFVGIDPERVIQRYEGNILSLAQIPEKNNTETAVSETTAPEPAAPEPVIAEKTVQELANEEPPVVISKVIGEDEDIFIPVPDENVTNTSIAPAEEIPETDIQTELPFNAESKKTEYIADSGAVASMETQPYLPGPGDNPQSEIKRTGKKSRKNHGGDEPDSNTSEKTAKNQKKTGKSDNAKSFMEESEKQPVHESHSEPYRRIVVEEPGSANMLFFGVFFILIIIAAIIIFLMNRGYF